MKKTLLFALLGCASYSYAQLAPLTVEKIMRDPKWMGSTPSEAIWSGDGKAVFFKWNPDGAAKDEIFKLAVNSNKPIKSSLKEMEEEIGLNYVYNANRSLAVAEDKGDIYVLDVKSKALKQMTNTLEREANPYFLVNDEVVFQKGSNLYKVNLKTAMITQITNFVEGNGPSGAKKAEGTVQDNWLKKQQEELFVAVKENQNYVQGLYGSRRSNMRGASETKVLKPIPLRGKMLSSLNISPDGKTVSYRLIEPAKNKNTIVPNYVTATGYTEDLVVRTKVGEQPTLSSNHIYLVEADSTFALNTDKLSGIKDIPEYFKEYPEVLAKLQKENKDRLINFGGLIWNPAGTLAVLVGRAQDNKDRWILKYDAATRQLTEIDRQHDEAWIGGPGISSFGNSVGWIDNQQLYFQSEATGYSHLYVANVQSGSKKQLTSGNWEVQSLKLSLDKKHFYLTANKSHPGIKHYYKLPVNGGELQQLTQQDGGNEVMLSPDEKYLAIMYSYIDTPWELYLQENRAGAKARQITASQSEEFKTYKWQKPEVVSFKNRFGDDVYARVYPSKNPHPSRPAVVFVHGAGYLQNVHYWWSQYFREYMFNNMLADNGYTVIDIDYTASSGYGRNHRTGIYRHMGGKDLSDHVDGVKMLVEKYGVNPKNVGLYGGSYGGFITLMGLFNAPETFKSGAALRSVTDWAHYNQGYTANILNEPSNDPIAFQRSSPINFADKLQGNLLMCHGMVDVNVHFQDVVRLSQKFIELGKDNWELAVYPIEDHGFTIASSWTDEYKRIYKLFETTLKQ